MEEGFVTPATWPRDEPLADRLLFLDPQSGDFQDLRMRDLPRRLRSGDVLVVNDAATLPASLQATTSTGEHVEVRLAGRGPDVGEWTAALLGRGDWRTRTEERSAPPRLSAGDLLHLGGDLNATVRRVWSVSPRLVDLVFDREGDALWQSLYRHGRPVQYSHVKGPLALWHVQTVYGARPWAVESPSAGLPLNWELLGSLRREGVALASLTHAAGLSSIGDSIVDALLPLPERFEIPEATVEAIEQTRREGGRVIAVGTSVVRALEGSAAAHGGRIRAEAAVTDLRINAQYRPRIVDGLLTGLHEPGSSHFSLLTAFAPEEALLDATRHAEVSGYLGHEFGDAMLIVGEARFSREIIPSSELAVRKTSREGIDGLGRLLEGRQCRREPEVPAESPLSRARALGRGQRRGGGNLRNPKADRRSRRARGIRRPIAV
jgi:S-adenosylmethionine:tRNA ribosyltransferase-isomerase